ncbi:MAG: quinone oxidoreductase family protein [Nitrososphaerales archaeon]
MKAVRIHEYGGPEVLRYEDVPIPEIGRKDALVKLRASGVNFVDIYGRMGLAPSNLPATLGVEGAGVVTKVGEEVEDIAVGDRVAYVNVQGSYAENAAVPADRLIKLPMEIDEHLAAASILQAMTAHYLTHDTFQLKRGQRALVHAGAGGAGQMLIQMCKMIGAYTVATTSTEEKAAIAKEAGADHVILYTEQDFEAELKRVTDGEGVHVVYDSVGKTTFEKSLRCLMRRGYLVLFGHSSGLVEGFAPTRLQKGGSLYLTRPTLVDYTVTREELLGRAHAVFELLGNGKLKTRIFKTLPLSQAAEAQGLLQSRATVGKVVLEN